jgi:hypothetical protein
VGEGVDHHYDIDLEFVAGSYEDRLVRTCELIEEHILK